MRALIGSVLLFVASLANANIVSIEPDDFAFGTNLSNATQGVHLSTLDGGAIFAAGVQTGNSFTQAPTGNLVFARGIGSGLSNWYPYPSTNFLGNIWEQNIVAWPDYALLVRFDRPTDYVSFQGGGYSVGPFMMAYDENGDLLQGLLTSNMFDIYRGPVDAGGGSEYFFSYEVASAQKNIGFVMIGGNDNNARVDNLRYASVPEPSTSILLLVGLALASLMTRRPLRQC